VASVLEGRGRYRQTPKALAGDADQRLGVEGDVGALRLVGKDRIQGNAARD